MLSKEQIDAIELRGYLTESSFTHDMIINREDITNLRDQALTAIQLQAKLDEIEKYCRQAFDSGYGTYFYFVSRACADDVLQIIRGDELC